MRISAAPFATAVLISLLGFVGCSTHPAPAPDHAAASKPDDVYRWANREWARLKAASDSTRPPTAQDVLDVAEIRWIAAGARAGAQLPIGGLLVIDQDESARRLQWCQVAIAAYERDERVPPHPTEWTRAFDDE